MATKELDDSAGRGLRTSADFKIDGVELIGLSGQNTTEVEDKSAGTPGENNREKAGGDCSLVENMR
jgi:hypothetical protein